MHISALHLYPVKSLRGISVQEARFDELGLEGDRRFLIIEESGKAITQRSDPALTLISTELTPEELVLRAPGSPELRVPLRAPAGTVQLLRPTEVWRASGMLAEDCGAEAGQWFTQRLGRPAHLVRIGGAFLRPMPVRKMPSGAKYATVPVGETGGYHDTQGSDIPTEHRVSFADAFPFLMLGEASLDDLNQRIATHQDSHALPLPLDRFRANLILADAPAYAEDSLGRFSIGRDAVFVAGGGCSRCVMTITDQATGERGVEPLRTLASYRRDPAKPTDLLFGQNILHESKSGVLRVGDRVMQLPFL